MSRPRKKSGGGDLGKGSVLKERYRLVECVCEEPLRRWLARDESEGDAAVVVLQYALSAADDGAAPVEQVKELAWLETPGLAVPRDVWHEGASLFVVEPVVRGRRLETAAIEDKVSTGTLLKWMIQVCGLYASLHKMKNPLVLGQISSDNVTVSTEGMVHLVGFELDAATLRLRLASGAEGWQCPDDTLTPQSDVWCVGKLFSHLLRVSGKTGSHLPGSLEHRLDTIIEAATTVDRARRFRTVSELKARLDDVARFRETLSYRAQKQINHLIGFSGVARWARFLRQVLLCVLWVSLFYCGWQGTSHYESFKLGGRWSTLAQLASLRPGTAVWIAGTVKRIPEVPLLPNPFTGVPSLGYSLYIRQQVSHQVFEKQVHRYATVSADRVALQQAHSQPFQIDDGAASVTVEPGGPVEMRQFVEFHWPITRTSGAPAQVGLLQVPLQVEPGEILRSVTFHESELKAGDAVCVYASVAFKDGHVGLGPPPLGAVQIYQGSSWDWSRDLFKLLLPDVVGLLVCAMLMWSLRQGRGLISANN
jgi:hypothetical protein